MRVAVVGGGVVGRCVLRELIRVGIDAVGFSTGEINFPPFALCQPFAGRSFRQPAVKQRAYKVASALWSEIGARTCKVFRPLSLNGGARLQNSLEYGRTLLGGDIFFTEHPTYGRGLTYDGAYIISKQEVLALATVLHPNTKVCRVDALSGQLQTEEEIISFDGIVLADRSASLAGFELTTDWGCKFKSDRKGEMAVCGGGAMLLPNGWCGSTHAKSRRESQNIEAVAEALAVPQGRELWSGQRVTTPDRMPVVGAIGSKTWVAAGMGGLGTLWGPAAAKWIASEILKSGSCPPELSPFRF